MNVNNIKRKITVAAFAFLFYTFISFGQSSTYLRALQLYQNNDYTQAKPLFQKEIADNPKNDAAYYYLAMICAEDEKSYNEAEKYFKTALNMDPENFWYKYYLAMLYQASDRGELTCSLLEELIDKYPEKSGLYYDAINAYFSQNETEKALAVMDKVEVKGGKNEMFALTRMNLMINKNKGDEKEAYAFLEEYYKDCKSPRMAAMLGDYCVRNYNDSLALDYYNQAIDMDSDYTPAYYGKAHIYQILRQYDKYFENIKYFIKDKDIRPESKAEYLNNLMESPQFVVAFIEEIDTLMLDAHNAHPMDTTLNSLLGFYYYQTDRQYLAIEIFRQTCELYPDSKKAAVQYASVLYSCNAWDLLKEATDSMLVRFPKDTDLRQLRAIAKWQINDLQGAIEDYTRLTELAPKDSAVTVFANSALGDLCYLTNQTKKAYKHYDKVLKCDPNYLPVLNNYAYYLSIEGKNLKKAREMSKKTIEQEPDNPTYLDTYAWILHLVGQDLEAKALFKHAMLYGGKESAVIVDHYAEVLYSLKEYDLAYIYWNQAKAMDDTLGITEKIQKRKQEQK